MTTPWLNQALVGVDRMPSAAIDGDVGTLLARISEQTDEPALAFSRAMGAMAACRLASVTLMANDAEPPPPADEDGDAIATHHPWSAILPSVFADGPLRLQFEACARVAAVNIRLSAPLLPKALDAGRRSTELRPALRAIIGHRGRWLAQFNDDWRYAASGVAEVESVDDPKLWTQGSLAQRVVYLRAARTRDAAAARALLQSQWGELPAKERLELISVLAHGLNADDEPLLDGTVKDRSRDVRDAAARLLAQLPQSAHARRLTGWLSALLTSKRSLLLVKTWHCDAPQTAEPAWSSAAIESTRPQHEALGERAWWLYQLARQVPLRWWTAHLQMTATDAIAWAAKGDWQAALYRGWRERVDASDKDWIEAMLASPAEEFQRHAATLLALLPVAEREKHWPRSLEQLAKTGTLVDVIRSCALGETLSAGFSRALIDEILACIDSDRLRNDYALRAQLLELATILHPSSMSAWRAPARRDDETPALAECIVALERIVALRRALHALY